MLIYNKEWKKPSNSRKELILDIKDIFLEAIDNNYKILIEGFGKNKYYNEFNHENEPYVLIYHKYSMINIKEIEEYIDRIIRYLKLNGFQTKLVLYHEKLHKTTDKYRRIFLYFYKY